MHMINSWKQFLNENNQRTTKVIDYEDIYKNTYKYVILSDEEFIKLYDNKQAEVMSDVDGTKVYFNNQYTKDFFKSNDIEIKTHL